MKALLMFATAGLGILLAAPPVLAGQAPAPFASASPGGALPQKGGRQTVAVDQLPAAVTAAILKAYPGSTIISATQVSRGAEVGYQLSVKTTTNPQPIAVMTSADGVIRTGSKNAAASGSAARKAPRQNAAQGSASPGETVAVNQLPKVVVQAIKDAYPKDVIVDATRFASGSQLLYQLTLSDVSSVMPMHVVVSSDGKIQKR